MPQRTLDRRSDVGDSSLALNDLAAPRRPCGYVASALDTLLVLATHVVPRRMRSMERTTLAVSADAGGRGQDPALLPRSHAGDRQRGRRPERGGAASPSGRGGRPDPDRGARQRDLDQHRERQADLLQAGHVRGRRGLAVCHGGDILFRRKHARRPGAGRGQPIRPRIPAPGHPGRSVPHRCLRAVRGLQDRPRSSPAGHVHRSLHLAGDVSRPDPRGAAPPHPGARGSGRHRADHRR